MKSLRFNSSLLGTLLASALAIGVATTPNTANAQMADTPVRANIPFSFQVDSKWMPAGTYTIRELSPHVLVIRDSNYTRVQTLMVHNTSSRNSPHRSSITFDLVGGQYFLRRIQLAETTNGVECSKSHAEKKAELESASIPQAPTVVALNTLPY